MSKREMLFICVHNSARSQMAAAFINQLCGHAFEAQSAGLEPGILNPLVVEALQEIGIDISRNKTQSVENVLAAGHRFSHVVTVCNEAEAEGCPFFPGGGLRLHWPFPDPSKLTGSRPEKLARVREIRDQIQMQVRNFCASECSSPAAAIPACL